MRARHEFHKMPATVEGLAPLPVPETCPWTLEELLAEEADHGDALPLPRSIPSLQVSG